jgi:hypothetical protein
MAMELRNTYRLNASVYNHGAEERRKEYERVRAIVQEQQQFIKDKGALAYPIRVRHIRIEEQCAVLVGGYRSDDEAKSALQNIRKLPPPDPKKVRLAVWHTGKDEDTASTQNINAKFEPLKDGQQGYVNPFKRAFVGRNPSIKMERPADWDKLDLAVLRKLNRDEPFSLLNCPKPVTIVVKQIITPAVIQQKSPSGKILDAMGLGGQAGERIDAAGLSAHNLAEALRKMKLDAFVLHTKNSSIVTVGAFNSTKDQELQSMLHLLETRVVPNMDPRIGLLPRPMPWDYRASITGS